MFLEAILKNSKSPALAELDNLASSPSKKTKFNQDNLWLYVIGNPVNCIFQKAKGVLLEIKNKQIEHAKRQIFVQVRNPIKSPGRRK